MVLGYLEKQLEMVSYGTFDLGDEILADKGGNIPSGFSVDPDRQALQVQANRLATAEGISLTDAVNQIGAQ